MLPLCVVDGWDFQELINSLPSTQTRAPSLCLAMKVYVSVVYGLTRPLQRTLKVVALMPEAGRAPFHVKAAVWSMRVVVEPVKSALLKKTAFKPEVASRRRGSSDSQNDLSHIGRI